METNWIFVFDSIQEFCPLSIQYNGPLHYLHIMQSNGNFCKQFWETNVMARKWHPPTYELLSFMETTKSPSILHGVVLVTSRDRSSASTEPRELRTSIDRQRLKIETKTRQNKSGWVKTKDVEIEYCNRHKAKYYD